MNKVTAWVLRDFHVYAAPERKGEKETKLEFRERQQIECTPEQLEVGRQAGLLSDQPLQALDAEGQAPSATASSPQSGEDRESRHTIEEE